MTTLVVGGTGVVGAAVAAQLERRDGDVFVLSRGGDAPAGHSLVGDVRYRGLALADHVAERLRRSVTHIVSAMGSVDWRAGPRAALETHHQGTRFVLDFARTCSRLERLVHVSSILALGRAEGIVGNRELDVGQSFRGWYEYGKFVAEAAVRAERELPWRVVRFGPVLGARGPVAPTTRHGLCAAVPFLVRGYPVHLTDHGDFPCYAGDSVAAAEVVCRALETPGEHDTWTWFDASMPTLGHALTALCSAWHVIPRIVASPLVGRVTGVLGSTLGVPAALREYASPWVNIDWGVLEALPGGPPQCPPDYLEATSTALRREVPAPCS